MNVVGLDLSITASGLANTRGECYTMGRKGITTLPLRQRLEALKQLRDDIVHWTAHQAPVLVVVEAPAFSRAGGGAVERHWLYLDVIDRLHARHLRVAEATATARARYATGKGNARKAAVNDAVARRWPDYITAGDDNLADAVVLAAMGADHLGAPLAPMPAHHRAALDKVAWPTLIGD